MAHEKYHIKTFHKNKQKELLEINKITFDSDEGWEEKKTTRS